MAKISVTRSFSRSAESYDDYAVIQSEVGERLLTLLDRKVYATILDLGCGTGNFTGILSERFADAEIHAVDISPAMIQVAARKLRNRRVSLWVADVETMELTGTYDLVTANASFQWFEDLPALMPKLAQACTAEGTLLFSSFGPNTYRELNACLHELWGLDAASAAQRFPDGAVLEHLLQEHFQQAAVQECIHTATFDCLWDLLQTIKCTGTQGGSSWEHRFTRTDVAVLEQAYLERFGCIVATYQVFYGRAQRKRDRSN